MMYGHLFTFTVYTCFNKLYGIKSTAKIVRDAMLMKIKKVDIRRTVTVWYAYLSYYIVNGYRNSSELLIKKSRGELGNLSKNKEIPIYVIM